MVLSYKITKLLHLHHHKKCPSTTVLVLFLAHLFLPAPYLPLPANLMIEPKAKALSWVDALCFSIYCRGVRSSGMCHLPVTYLLYTMSFSSNQVADSFIVFQEIASLVLISYSMKMSLLKVLEINFHMLLFWGGIWQFLQLAPGSSPGITLGAIWGII